jgi:hypothetical protein
MFFPMTPEMINNIIELNKKRAPLSFEEYYNKRLVEECKYFLENPKFSVKYFIVWAILRKNIRDMALKEYKKKWPLAPIIKINNELDSANESVIDAKELVIDDKELVISDYDIIEESNIIEEDATCALDLDNAQSVYKTEVRRSSRLKNKSN